MTRHRILETVNVRPKSAGEKIFDNHWFVEMQAYNAIDDREVAIRGEFTTGDPEIDAKMNRRPTRVYRSITELVELWHSGVDFKMVNGLKDIQRINDILQEHFNDCEKYHRMMVSSFKQENREVTQERLADLKVLDEFGKYIYNKVRQHGKGESGWAPQKAFNRTSGILSRDKSDSTEHYRNAPDYVTIEERINYGGLGKRKRG